MQSLRIKIALPTLGCLLLALSSSNTTYGKGRSVPTMFISADGGVSTHKSKLVSSNDTATATRYGMGIYAGVDKVIGFGIRTDTQTTAFELNDSSVSATWQETFLRYRFGNFSTGAIISLVSLSAESTANSQDFDLTGSGYGGFLHYVQPFGRIGKLSLEIDSVNIDTIKESNQVSVTLGQRLDIDFGASFSLTKKDWLELLVGYRTRSLSVTTDASYKDEITTTYMGLSTVFLF